MNIKNEIEQLQKEGWDVKIKHMRFYEPTPIKVFASTPYGESNEENFHTLKISPRGGVTRVTLVREHQTITAKAMCSKKDNYSRKLGVTIALGRVKKFLEEQ